MKILAFADIHGDISAIEHFKKEVKEKKIDVVVCAGDYTFFENYIEHLTEKLSEIPCPVLLVHGNHEFDEVVEVLCKKYNNVHFIHKKAKKMGNYVFIGYGGGGFATIDPEFVKTMKGLAKKINKTDKIVLVTHAPAYNTKLDFMPGYGHVGNKDYRKFIESNNVVLAISGHIHESFGAEDKIGKAKLISPGFKGRILTLE